MAEEAVSAALSISLETLSADELRRRLELPFITTTSRSGKRMATYGGETSTMPARRQLADLVGVVSDRADALAELPEGTAAELSLGVFVESEGSPVNLFVSSDELAALGRARVSLALSFYGP